MNFVKQRDHTWFCFLGPGRLEVRVECLDMVVVLCDEVVFEVLLVVL